MPPRPRPPRRARLGAPLLLLSILALLLVAAGAAAQDAARPGTAHPDAAREAAGPAAHELDSAQAAPIRLEFWTIDLARSFGGFLRESIDAYEREHPGVELVWRDVSLGALGDELARAHAAGSAPDLVNVNVPLALGFAERGLLRDLDASLGARDEARYFDDLLASFRIEGRQLALPWYLTMPVLIYDPDAFERAGLDPADPPATTAEAHAAARTLHERLGGPAWWPNLTGQQLLYRFVEAGLPIVDADGRRALFDGEAHAAFLEELVALFVAGVIPAEAFEEGTATATGAFLEGSLPMIAANPQLLGRLRAADPERYARVRVARYPLGPGETIHAPLMGFAVTAASAHPDAALDLARFLTGDERQLAFARETAILPSARGAAADPWFGGGGRAATPEERARRVAASQLPHARDLTMELPNASVLFARFEEAVERAFHRYASPAEALRAAARFWNALL